MKKFTVLCLVILSEFVVINATKRKCGRNAYWCDEASVCPVTCATYGKRNVATCDALSPGCACNEGYVFKDSQKGDCVKSDQCSKEHQEPEQPKCGRHAHYSTRTSVCPITCSTYGKKGVARCRALGPGCECDEGYTFNENQKGDCVKPDQCPKCQDDEPEQPKCGRHAHYSTGASVCPVTCATYGKKGGAHCLALGPGCECDEGYTFKENQKGDCVKPDQCPKSPDDEPEQPKCGRHAHYSTGASVCPETCATYGKKGVARCLALGPGCECDEGYTFKENQKGDCVKPDQCPKSPDDEPEQPKCGRHAHWSSGASACPITCATYGKKGIARCFALGPGCECDEGYTFKKDQKGDCVKPDQCSQSPDDGSSDQPKCGRHAHYNSEASVCPVTCATYGKKGVIRCYALGPGCVCDDGYTFKENQKGDCVKPDQCPKSPDDGTEQPKCGRHAHYSTATSGCPVTCATYGKKGIATCFVFGPGCECDDGYTFKENQKGDCVKPDQCPKAPDDDCKQDRCGRNAHWSKMTSVCPATCSSIGSPKCFALGPGCECDKGYIFAVNQKGDCIKECDCPSNGEDDDDDSDEE